MNTMGNFNRDSRPTGNFRGGFSRGGRGGGRNFDRGDRGSRPMFQTVCSNCGKDCEVPFRPTGEKPVYCNDCFPKFSNRPNKQSFDRSGNSQNNSQLGSLSSKIDGLNSKLEKILNLLQPKTEVQAKKESKNMTQGPGAEIIPAQNKAQTAISENTEPLPSTEEKTKKVKKSKKKTAVKKEEITTVQT